MADNKPEVAVIMGSASDWETMKHACEMLDQFEVPYMKQVISAHRTPELMGEFAHNARANGLKVIIAGAGGAAHLPGMVAAQTTLPVIGVPVRSHALSGWDSLLSIVQMPGGIPVATTAVGNCGFSLAPYGGAFAAEKRENDAPILGRYPESFRFQFPEYLNALEHSAPGMNLAALIGLGAVRISLTGFSDAPLSSSALNAARGMLQDALDAGAAGISAGIMYLPEYYTTRDEYRAMLAPLRGTGKPLVTHIRGEGDGLVASVREVIEIAREAECPLEISHFKSCGKQNWRKEIFRAIDEIENARAHGQDVTVDFYPYTGGSTALTTMLPPAFVKGDMAAALKALGTREGVDEFREFSRLRYDGWDNYALTLGWERIIVSGVCREHNRKFCGLTVTDAAQKFGFDDAEALAAYLMHDEAGQTSIINLSMHPDDVDAVARLPYASVISDALYADSDTPHPRKFGAMPRLWADFVRARHVLAPEEAIRKMTRMPAERLGLKGRGTLAAGGFADVLAFESDAFRDCATYSSPTRPAQGVRALYVNGQARILSDALTGAPSGRLIRP